MPYEYVILFIEVLKYVFIYKDFSLKLTLMSNRKPEEVIEIDRVLQDPVTDSGFDVTVTPVSH